MLNFEGRILHWSQACLLQQEEMNESDSGQELKPFLESKWEKQGGRGSGESREKKWKSESGLGRRM